MGMVSANFSKKMLEWVKENRRTPEEAAATWPASALRRLNIARVNRILSEARLMNR